jgi:hypothetical protein
MSQPLTIPEEMKGQMRQYKRLLLCYADFKHAIQAADYILGNSLHDKHPQESGLLLPAINCSMIIAYARPFSGNGGRGEGIVPDLPGRYLRLLNEKERNVHETVLWDRNKFLAHSDAEAAELEPVRFQINEAIDMVVPVVAWRMAPLEIEPTRALLSASRKLFEATLSDREPLEKLLLPYFRVAGVYDLYATPDA